MSMSSILIYRDFPIINGYVQVPPVRATEKTKITTDEALDAVSGSVVTRLSLGSGRCRGSKSGQQEWLRLPAIAQNGWYTTDPTIALGGGVE